MAKSHEQHKTMLSDEVLDNVKGVTSSGLSDWSLDYCRRWVTETVNQ